MTVAAPQSTRSSTERTATVPWRRRPDLIVRPQDSGAWIVKDPLTLSYLLLNEREMAVLQQLDGRKTGSEILTALQTAWPEDDLQISDVLELVGQLIQNRLLISTARTQPLIEPAKAPGRSLRFLPGIVSRLLRIQIRLLNPAPLLDRLQPLIFRLFSKPSAVVAISIVTVAAMLVVFRFEQLTHDLPGPWDFFGPDNLVLLLGTFVLAKAMHEVGHAFAARRFGAECHEAGVMLMLFTPVLYTNVTDAWILDRRSRLMITAAGMIVELLLASGAAILWFFAAPGLFKALLANTMVLCTVSTVLFNGNPLLRYDAYFLLADAIGQPNLAQRASARVQRLWEDLLLGSRPETTDSGEWFLVAYGLVAAIYRTVLAVAILALLLRLFDQWNLRIAGFALMGLAAVSIVIMPAAGIFSGILVELLHRNNRRRRLLRACSVMLCLLAVMLIPLPQAVVVPAIVEPDGVPIFATLSGDLVSMVPYGRLVTAGEQIAMLEDISLQRQLVRFQGDTKVQEVRIRAMELRRDGGSSSLLPEARKTLATSKSRVEQFEKELQRLEIRSPTRGLLMPPRALRQLDDDEALGSWNGFPLEKENVGARLEEGTLLGYVCDLSEAELLLTLTNEDRLLISASQNATFQPTGFPGLRLRGIVQEVASLDVEEVPEELTAAGLVAPLSAAKGDEGSKRWQAVVRVTVSSSSAKPCLYSTGMVRVDVEPISLAGRLLRFLRVTFR